MPCAGGSRNGATLLGGAGPLYLGCVRNEARSLPSDRPAARDASRPAVVAAVVATWLVLLVGIAEGVPRLFGYRTWKFADDERTNPRLHEAEPRLGWVNEPGHYVLPPWVEGGPEVEITYLPDGSRATGAERGGGRPRVAFVGCSVTAGYGLSDPDTFAWKIQQKHPELEVVNFGTAGYGTVQSLLRMETVLGDAPPRLVLYGFISKHEPRNVATYTWLRGLQLHSRRGHVSPPYVSLGKNGALVRHPPEAFSVWPLADRLVSVRIAGDAWMHLVTWGREANGPEATKRLVLEMNRVARERSTAFAVVFLLAEEGKKDDYARFFEQNDVPWMDCVKPNDEDYRIPGEGHPNGELNSIWAECVSAKLPGLLGAVPRASS